MAQGGDRQAKASESRGLLSRLFGRDAAPDSRRYADAALDLSDIQGFILRGYRMPMVRHFLLTVGVPAKARQLLGRLASGNEADAPQINCGHHPRLHCVRKGTMSEVRSTEPALARHPRSQHQPIIARAARSFGI